MRQHEGMDGERAYFRGLEKADSKACSPIPFGRPSDASH
jgi:hypothetical protein